MQIMVALNGQTFQLKKYLKLPTKTHGKIRITLKNLVFFPYTGCFSDS